MASSSATAAWGAGTGSGDLGTGSLLARGRDLILPIGIIASVLVIMVPLPAALMDVLLAANITIAVLVLLTTIYVRQPLEFSVFPSMLLATTLARLVLNVATTRLILTRAGQDGINAAGHVVASFADFVAGANVVVGMIIFIIIVVIQFMVITKGATRISEVAARFALDGMPGKQMAIDADLNAGIIDEREAQTRRSEITRQADFYGAMDGASKFVRGDAIAGIIITLINIVGGLIIGMVEFRMSLAEAAKVYTHLTIGDGLVSQVPAFLISLAAGLLVTRSTQKANLPREFMTADFFAAAGAGGDGRVLGDVGVHQLAAVAAVGVGRLLLGAVAGDLAARIASCGYGGEDCRGREEREAGRRAGRGLSHGRSDGDRTRRGADSVGGSESWRRFARTRAEGAAEHCGRDRHFDAEGSHSRQHAARSESVSDQDCRHSDRAGRVAADAVAGDRFGDDDRRRSTASRRRTRRLGRMRSGSIRGSRIRPRCMATRWWSRARCWRRI